MRRNLSRLVLSAIVVLAGCTSGSAGKSQTPAVAMPAATGTTAAPSATGPSATGPGAAPLSFEQVTDMVDAYKSTHAGNRGKDSDINAKTANEVAADLDARKLLSLCGTDRRPVIPLLAWEYGGNDHRWIHPERSALVYCIYTPVPKTTADWSEHWKYDRAKNHVTVDMYVLFPDRNPCRDKPGPQQVDACIGDATNYEILVDTASLNDGHDAGLELAESSTSLWLITPDKTKVLLANID